MQYNVDLYRNFSRKMQYLATFVGLFIMISMPLTYFLMSYEDQEVKAEYLSKQVSEKVVGIIKSNPKLWNFMVVKFTQVFTESESEEITKIVIYDADDIVIDQVIYQHNSILNSVGRTRLEYNNAFYGYVDVWKNADKTLFNTGILFVVFTSFAFAIAFIIFNFPGRIIKKAQTDINMSMDRLNNLSYLDQITNLRNRTYLNEIFPLIIAENKTFSILFLDLDNFKHINDSYGHSYGDQLLVAVSERLHALVRSEDIIIRFGGDEFMIVFLNFVDKAIMDKKAQSFVDEFSKPVQLNELTIFVTASIGIVIYPRDGSDLTQLVMNADAAMYTAKKNGRNNYCYYTDEMNKKSLENLQIVNNLHEAIERDEFILYYQPKFDIDIYEIAGCEILLRWLHPVRGMISPGDFIPIAEESGLIVPIGEKVISKAFAQIKGWVDQYNIAPMRFSINISPRQFQQENLISYIKAELDRTGLDPRYIELEITENVAMQNTEAVYEKLMKIKDIGLNISIDDFGTGYSSMSYLKKFPVDTIKIDMQFIRDINKVKGNDAIVFSIISMAHNLGMDVVAEGIETDEQLEVLRKKKCDYGQGYLFSRPVPPEDFIMLIEKKQAQGA